MEQKDPKEVHKCDFYLLFVDPNKSLVTKEVKYVAF